MVSDAVSRNRFSAILSNIHFANNNSLDYSDKFAKVRLLLDHVVNTGPRSGTGQSSTSVSTWLSKTHSNSIVNRRESLKSRHTTCCHSAERLFSSAAMFPPARLPAEHRVLQEVRTDNTAHWIVQGSQHRCAAPGCVGTSVYACEKGNVGLHPGCFKLFHTN